MKRHINTFKPKSVNDLILPGTLFVAAGVHIWTLWFPSPIKLMFLESTLIILMMTGFEIA